VTRYFFNVRSGDTYFSDAEGQEYVDLGAAQEEAEMAAREIISEAVMFGQPIDSRKFEITDASGTICATLPFRDVLRFS
jgi:hypothetical protein